jgi:hypothetical protein
MNKHAVTQWDKMRRHPATHPVTPTIAPVEAVRKVGTIDAGITSLLRTARGLFAPG